MKNNVQKQCVGIDCAKDELAVCFGQLTGQWKVQHKSTAVFANGEDGYKSLVRWAKKLSEPGMFLYFVMEATGVYHENLAHYLADTGMSISVILPSKARHFAQTLKVRTVNDKESSKMLATMGLEKQLDKWQKPDPVFAHLRKLTRERERLLDARTQNKNELHAEEHGAVQVKSIIKRLKKSIRLQDNQVAEIEQDIKTIVQSYPVLNQKLKKICTIPGVGFMTAITVIAECNGFHLFRNKKQLVCYAGYDVVEKQSGTSVNGKSRISGKGNKHIRKALHFPALGNVRHDSHHQNLYVRLVAKHGIKMKAYTAVQRKLLVLIYTLWRKDQIYHPEYNTSPSSQHKLLEQPIGVALTELNQVRSCDCVNLKAKIKNNFQIKHEISKT